MAGRTQDPREAMRAEHPDSWIPVEPGDTLTGTVTDVQEAWSDVRQQGSWYPLISVQVAEATGYEPGAELKVHAFGAVLYNEIMRRRPEVGEEVTFTFDGEREPKTKGMSPTKVYTLKVHGREHEGASVYDSIAREQPASTVGRKRQAGEPAPVTDAEMRGGDAARAQAGPDDDADVPF